MKKSLAAWLLIAAAAAGAASGPGDVLPALTLKDQADRTHTLDAAIRRVYANSDRKGDALMKEAMAGRGQAQLDAQQAVVIAEISAAPFFVKSIIRSSLKDRGYTTWLDTKGDTQALLPYRANQVTVIELEQRRITAIRHIGDAAALRRELGPEQNTEKP